MTTTTTTYKTVSAFTLGMSAASLHDALATEGIQSRINQPKWTNKRLPPPRIEVQVAEADIDAATVVLAAFKRARA